MQQESKISNQPQNPVAKQRQVVKQPAGGAGRIVAGVLLVAYAAVIVASAALRPRDAVWLAAIALLPGAAAFVAGVPKVARRGPRGIMAIFHLFVYPLLAVLTIGLTGALIAYLLTGVFEVGT